MSKSISFKMPKSHVDTLLKFFDIPIEQKEAFFQGINSYNGELTPRDLYDYLSKSIETDKKFLLDLSEVYLTFIHSFNSYTGTSEQFVNQVGISIKESSPDFDFDDQTKIYINKLLLSGKGSADKLKVIELMSENQRNYVDSKIYQSLRTVFDDDGQIIGSAIVHNLKLTISDSDNDKKEYFFSLDKADLADLIEQVRKAQENAKRIEETFPNANIFDL